MLDKYPSLIAYVTYILNISQLNTLFQFTLLIGFSMIKATISGSCGKCSDTMVIYLASTHGNLPDQYYGNLPGQYYGNLPGQYSW